MTDSQLDLRDPRWNDDQQALADFADADTSIAEGDRDDE